MKRRIKKEHVAFRFNVLIVIVYIIGIILVVRLFDLQIVNGAEYRETSNTRLSRVTTLESARGEILDRSGNVLASNNITYNLELYKTKSDDETLNNCILNLVNLLEEYEKSYPDNFPINTNKEFTIEGDTLTQWLEEYDLEKDASEQDVIDYFVDKYGITNSKWKQIRKILAIRYEITTEGYSSTKSITIAEDIPDEIVAQISERSSDFPGITISTDTERTYPYENLASHVLGYIGRITQTELDESDYEYASGDYIGKTGIEAVFEEYLRGQDGEEEIEMSVDGTVTGTTVTENAIQGSSIVLTIDAQLQEVAENALDDLIEGIKSGEFSQTYDAQGGAVVVLDVDSGEVLALASNPDYDPNEWVGGISQSVYSEIVENNALFNKAISGTYAPGSIFKMATATAALETGSITSTETIYDTGVYTRFSDYQPVCWYYTSYHKGHGSLNVAQAIQKSCNYFFYEAGYRTGIDNIVKYASYYGLGQKTGIELTSETAGTLSSPDAAEEAGETWSSGMVLSSSIGQSYNAFSPLQIAKYIAMIANGGNDIDVSIVKTIMNADGTQESTSAINEYVNEYLGLEDTESEDLEISDSTLEVIKEAMESVALEQGGTAYSIFKDFDIEVGGKTGSAEVSDGTVNAWFVGFAPYDDPEIAVVVLVENGGHGNYAATAVKEIIAEYFGMNISDEDINEDNSAQTYVEEIN